MTILRTTGCSRTQAARHVEVDYSTFRAWMARSTAFRLAVERAETDYEMALLGRARAHAQVDSRTATWLIEHHPRLRAEWGQKVEVTGGLLAEGSIEVKHTHGLTAGAGDSIDRLTRLAAAFDVLVRVGILPRPGERAESAPRLVSGGDTEVDEVYPA